MSTAHPTILYGVQPRRARDAVLAVLLSVAMIAGTLIALARPAEADEHHEVEFEVTAHDLEFILKSAHISEAHAAASVPGDAYDEGYSIVCDTPPDPLTYFPLGDERLTCVPSARLPWGLRTVTGELNNLNPGREQFGAGGNIFPRLVPQATQGDAGPVPDEGFRPPGEIRPAGTTSSYTQSSGYVYDPMPRLISNLISDQTTNNPAAIAAAEATGGTIDWPDVGGPTEAWVTLEDNDDALSYTGDWIEWESLDRTDGRATYTSSLGASVTFSVEDGFRWIGSRGPHRGIAHVLFDGEFHESVDQYADVPDTEDGFEYGVVLFEATDLAAVDEVTIVHTNVVNDGVVGGYSDTEIDAIELLAVTPGEPSGVGNVFIPDVSPDEGLSAPFTNWFTLFGQFFDHGLDMVEKGGNGTVIVPLLPGDPLWDRTPANLRFIALTRATQHGGPTSHLNRTTPFVDQNQTYTSHPAHQVFLREYKMVDGLPVPTGHLLDGAAGGLATWADIKTQARTMLGIELNDMDVHAVPMVVADPYGRFVPGANGLPMLATATGLVQGNLATPVKTSEVNGLYDAGHAFLDDIAHGANPTGDGQHDADLLDDHFITGDGRGNENIGLTAVHHVFHSEHNRLVDHIAEVLNRSGNEDLLARYQENTFWDYEERLFQAARFVTEMQYQHLVFEEFARTISPEIDVQPLNETAYHDDLDASIWAEFAHVVYRFGHSMLTETVERRGFGTDEELSLLEAFLNPRLFLQDAEGNPITADQGAAAVIHGTTQQTGNAIDEFLTETLRNNLLGLPLDLGAINIARARETGSPTLQQARQRFYNETLDASVEPYAHWRDFMLALKHRESIVNFVAAYGIDDELAALRPTGNVALLRARGEELVADSEFMLRPAADSGLNDVDFWIGGLAEDLSVFGGFLGPTFNYVFERQLENLQNGDRFYYLTRTQGLNLLHQLENNSFTEMILRNTDASLLHANVFANPDEVFDLTDVSTLDHPNLIITGNEYRFDGEDHIVMHGTDGDDVMIGGKGDDSIWGHGGNDRIQGGQGNDTLHGGPGDDIIQDEHGDDVIHAGPGNDAVNAGSGADLIFGGSGKDFLLHGSGPTSTSFAGSGDDFVRGGPDADIITGNEGDDWLEGNAGHDLLQGDNALTFQNDPYGGHDVLIGGPGNDDHDAEGGDDIMLNNGIDRHAGMLGFDWVTHQDDPNPGRSDLDISIYQPFDVTLMRSRYFSIEGLSGWKESDILRGASTRGDQPFNDGSYNELTHEGIQRINGLADLLQYGGPANRGFAARFMTPNVSNNIILGGKGSDIIEGRAGDDFIDGSSWLRVQLEWRNPNGPWERGSSMVYFQGRVFAGTINPGDLYIVREIIEEDDSEVCDTAVYSDVRAAYTISSLGEGYHQVEHTGAAADDDADDGAVGGDGSDVVRNIDRLRFADRVHDLTDVCNSPAGGTITFSTESPVQGVEITATADLQDADGLGELSFEWQYGEGDNWSTAPTSDGTDTFVPTSVEAGSYLRVIVTFLDGGGALESVTSDPTLNPVEGVDPTTPGMPTIGIATAGDASATVSWTAPTNDGGTPITSYVVEAVAQTDGDTNRTVTGIAADATSATATGLINGNTYQLRVRAVNAEGEGLWSGLSNAVVPQGVVTPPVNSPATAGVISPFQPGPGSTLTATLPTDANGTTGATFAYQWQQSTDGGLTWTSVGTGPSFQVTGQMLASVLRVIISFTDDDGFDEEVTYAQTAPVAPGGGGGGVGGDQNATTDTTDTGTGGTIGITSFTDISTSIFQSEIFTLVDTGVANGCTATEFCPTGQLTRGQMATFLANALDLEPPVNLASDGGQPVTFADINGNIHADNIVAIVAAGIASGYGDGNFGPNDLVTRQQMATFLSRALNLPEPPAGSVAPFADLNHGSGHNTHILRIYLAGITSGTSATTYDPNGFVTRGQMAAFLVRALSLGEEDES